MKKDINCKYSILDRSIICEHKTARIDLPGSVVLHNHDGYEILLFLGGDASFFVESQRKELQRGDLILVPPYSFHGINLSVPETYERTVINIRDKYLRTLCTPDTDLSACFYQTASNRLQVIHLSEQLITEFSLLAMKLETAVENKPYAYEILASAYLSELLILINEHSFSSPQPSFTSIMPNIVAETFSYIENNLTTDISIKSIAEQLHHNSDYLSRSFKAIAGCTLQQYILAKRIALAQLYLQKGVSPLDACFLAGFKNYSSFSRAFSKRIGVSPKKYQQTCYCHSDYGSISISP